MTFVYENGCYRIYSRDMVMGVIKQYIANYDEKMMEIIKVGAALEHITTDLNYVGQDELDADESLINFNNGLLYVTDKELTLKPHTPGIYSTIQIPCNWTDKPALTPVFDAYMHTVIKLSSVCFWNS